MRTFDGHRTGRISPGTVSSAASRYDCNAIHQGQRADGRLEKWRQWVTRSGQCMCLAMGLLLCMVAEAEAVARNKARLIASTELKVGCRGEWGRSPVGRITSSGTTFLFSSGSLSLTIPYVHIESLKYGRPTRQERYRLRRTPCPDASFVDFPPDYYPIVHDLLTMDYRDAKASRRLRCCGSVRTSSHRRSQTSISTDTSRSSSTGSVPVFSTRHLMNVGTVSPGL